MELEVTGEVFHRRGPAPHHVVSVSPDVAATLHSVAGALTYGWGMVPVAVRIGDTTWETSLFPKDGGYLLPLRAAVRHGEGVELGDTVTATVRVIGL